MKRTQYYISYSENHAAMKSALAVTCNRSPNLVNLGWESILMRVIE